MKKIICFLFLFVLCQQAVGQMKIMDTLDPLPPWDYKTMVKEITEEFTKNAASVKTIYSCKVLAWSVTELQDAYGFNKDSMILQSALVWIAYKDLLGNKRWYVDIARRDVNLRMNTKAKWNYWFSYHNVLWSFYYDTANRFNYPPTIVWDITFHKSWMDYFVKEITSSMIP